MTASARDNAGDMPLLLVKVAEASALASVSALRCSSCVNGMTCSATSSSRDQGPVSNQNLHWQTLEGFARISGNPGADKVAVEASEQHGGHFGATHEATALMY